MTYQRQWLLPSRLTTGSIWNYLNSASGSASATSLDFSWNSTFEKTLLLFNKNRHIFSPMYLCPLSHGMKHWSLSNLHLWFCFCVLWIKSDCTFYVINTMRLTFISSYLSLSNPYLIQCLVHIWGSLIFCCTWGWIHELCFYMSMSFEGWKNFEYLLRLNHWH